MSFTTADYPEYRATATIYRSPSAAGGTVGALAPVGTVAGALIPASSFSQAPAALAPDGLAGTRYDLAFIHAGTAVRRGDELRINGTAYKVQKVDRWALGSVAFVEEPQ